MPSTTEARVPRVAWVRVCPMIRQVRGAVSTSATPAGLNPVSSKKPRPTRETTGHTKNTSRNNVGGTAAAAETHGDPPNPWRPRRDATCGARGDRTASVTPDRSCAIVTYPMTVAVHALIQASRWAAITSAGTVIGASTTAACFCQACGQRHAPIGRVHVHLIGNLGSGPAH